MLIFKAVSIITVSAQQSPVLHSDTLHLPVWGDTLQLPNAPMVPGSLRVVLADGTVLPNLALLVDYGQGQLWWTDSLWATPERLATPVRFSYRAFPPGSVPQLIALRDPGTAKADTNFDQIIFYEEYGSGQMGPKADPFAMFQEGGLQRSGSFSRSVTLGTNRDVAVNSDFRLQLGGMIGNDIEILASITDQNIPIQPSGTTQQINDFDRIFIQLKKDKLRATFGDLELQQRGTEFVNFYRNVLGAQVEYLGQDHRFSLAGSAAKGQFHSQSFQGRNGNQGPYRLQGKNGETFIIILAGSEQVFINGQRVQRGQDKDYIMDYNTGELTFMARRMITDAMRIVVDFEYADRNYGRSFVLGQYAGRLWDDRLGLQFTYGRQADNPNAPVDFELTDVEREALQQAGDNPFGAVVSGIDSLGWAPGEVRYARRDSTVGSRTYRDVYVFSSDSLEAQWRLFFSFVGAGNGNYVRAAQTLNANVWEWVAPDSLTGQSRGDWAPLRAIPLPRSLQVADLKWDLRLAERLSFYGELAVSSEDQNRLSPLDDDDNSAAALLAGVRLAGLPLGEHWKLGTDLRYKFVDARFQSLDRVYEAEYGRAWNFDDLGTRANENITEGTLDLSYRERYSLRVNPGFRQMGDSLFTQRLNLDFVSTDSNIVQGWYKLVLLNSEDRPRDLRSQWWRHNGELFRYLGQTRPGIELWIEDKDDTRNDVLQQGSFRFWDLTGYLKRDKGSPRFSYALSYNYRYDQAWADSLLRNRSYAWQPGLQLTWQASQTLTLSSTSNYRQFRVLDSAFVTQGLDNNNSLTANLQANYQTRNRVLTTNFLYQVLSESVARRDLVYVQVTPGQGTYEWIDYNSDGRQDLDEFQLSTNPLTANFIRILQPTRDLFPAIGLNLAWVLNLDLRPLLTRKPQPKPDGSPGTTPAPPNRGLRKWLAAITTTTSLRMDQQRNATEARLGSYIVRFSETEGLDTSLTNALINFRQDMFFFRNSPKGDFNFSYLQNRSQQFLSSGIEERATNTWQARQRWNFKSDRSLENSFQYGRRLSLTELFESRNFDIQFLIVQPTLAFQLTRQVRVSGGYEFKQKVNTNAGGNVDSRMTSHKLIADGKFNLKQRNNLFLKAELFRIVQDGVPNATANFEILESMQPGMNFVLTALLTFYLTNSLEMSVVYDGRVTSQIAPIHSGRMQVKALF